MAGGATTQPSSFGVLLRRHRIAAGLSQEALAEQAGLSARGLSDLERGARRLPYRDTVQRLARALGLRDDEHAILLAASRRVRATAAAARRQPKRSLPLPRTSFVGRSAEQADVARLLESTSLLTLTGAGGI